MKYKGTWGTMSTVAAEEGFWGLWKGNFANVLRVVPVYALKFSFNDSFKAMVGGNTGNPLTFTQLMMSGTLAVCTTRFKTAVASCLTVGFRAGPLSIVGDISPRSGPYTPVCWRGSWLALQRYCALRS